MSTCWKCGATVAEGSVECEYGCALKVNAEAADEKELQAQLLAGDAAVAELVMKLAEHIERMGAGGLRLTVSLNEQIYDLQINRRRK